MRSHDFFAQNPVFTRAEFEAWREAAGRTSPNTTRELLARHVAAGALLRVRRGLYASVPRGVAPSEFRPDPYLILAKLADDAVAAYHAALQFHGRSYSVWQRFHYVSSTRRRPFVWRGVEFLPVQARGLDDGADPLVGGWEERRYGGGIVRVATLERCLVDVLDSPERGGGWEELWRSLEMVEYFDLERVLVQVQRKGSATTAARVGLFLALHREELAVDQAVLDRLAALSPRGPLYLDRNRAPGRLVRPWNLIVPESVLDGSWAEVL